MTVLHKDRTLKKCCRSSMKITLWQKEISFICCTILSRLHYGKRFRKTIHKHALVKPLPFVLDDSGNWHHALKPSRFYDAEGFIMLPHRYCIFWNFALKLIRISQKTFSLPGSKDANGSCLNFQIHEYVHLLQTKPYEWALHVVCVCLLVLLTYMMISFQQKNRIRKQVKFFKNSLICISGTVSRLLLNLSWK